jgi:hypothetical protein
MVFILPLCGNRAPFRLISLWKHCLRSDSFHIGEGLSYISHEGAAKMWVSYISLLYFSYQIQPISPPPPQAPTFSYFQPNSYPQQANRIPAAPDSAATQFQALSGSWRIAVDTAVSSGMVASSLVTNWWADRKPILTTYHWLDERATPMHATQCPHQLACINTPGHRPSHQGSQ